MVMPVEAMSGAARAGLLASFGSREELLRDLAEATADNAQSKVLAIFAFEGFRDLVNRMGRPQSQAVLAELSVRLEQTVGSAGACYWPREDEFAVLCDANTTDIPTLLHLSVDALNERSKRVGVTAAFGMVTVPDEALEPIAALKVADAQLAAAQPGREPRALRRHLRQVVDDEAAPGPEESAPEPRRADPTDPASGAVRTWRIDQLLDIARTLTALSDAARIDNSQTSGLQGQPRDAARIPLLLKELGLRLIALDTLGGPPLPEADALAQDAGLRMANIGGRVLAALDEIGTALATA